MSDQARIMERLRAETRDVHRHAEGLAFFTALEAGTLPLASYVGLLHALGIIYDVFEREMLHAQQHLIAAVWDDSLRKLPLIQRDLAYFQPQNPPAAPVAALRAQLLAQSIRQRGSADPGALLGYLYVLEGSTLGGLVLRDQVARAFGLRDSNGLAYLSSYERATKAHWREFGQCMERTQPGSIEQQQMIDAAHEMFTGIGRIIEALYPFDAQPPRDLVRVLNPEAGAHPLPNDPRELQAALRAGERSWREFPYYEWRYGQRGERFTRSDSAWLVTLSDHPQTMVEQQVLWLGRVLAARGMPQWMLERHLEMLHEELIAAVPEKQAAYARLQRAAQTLHDLRRLHIGDDLFQSLMAEFDRRVGSEWSARLPWTGGLLAAAVADEKSGVVQAVPSIEGWMTDPERFPTAWVEAVQTTIRRAREG